MRQPLDSRLYLKDLTFSSHFAVNGWFPLPVFRPRVYPKMFVHGGRVDFAHLQWQVKALCAEMLTWMFMADLLCFWQICVCQVNELLCGQILKNYLRWLCITSWYESSTWWHWIDCLQCYSCSCGIIPLSVSKYLPCLTSYWKLNLGNYVRDLYVQAPQHFNIDLF